MDLKEIESIVNNSLRKTINRFREKPLYYFTESDIHSSLQGDLLSGNSKCFYVENKISLVHLEYPTNFRYEKDKLSEGYDYEENNPQKHMTSFSHENNKRYGDRGNFDLAILNPDFVQKVLDDEKKNISSEEAFKIIINKDIELLKQRNDKDNYGLENIQEEVLYCIEVKYIHLFNARNKNMIDEIIKDNEKLKLALYHSNGFIRPINLIFCSSESQERRDDKQAVIDEIKEYINNNNPSKKLPDGVVNIFIQSYYGENASKTTPKPIFHCSNPKEWANELKSIIPNETYNS